MEPLPPRRLITSCKCCNIDHHYQENDNELYFVTLKNTVGEDALERIVSSQIIIIASIQDALTIEIVKNVQLQGIQSVVIYDINHNIGNGHINDDDTSTTYTSIYDNNIFGSKCKEDILMNLNSINRNINAHPIQVNDGEDISSINDIPYFNQQQDNHANVKCIIVLNQPSTLAKEIDERCHQLGTPCVIADTKGVYGRVFSDFGSSFKVFDENSLCSFPFHVVSVDRKEESKTNFEIYHYQMERKQPIEAGTLIRFHNMTGLEFLNEQVFTVEKYHRDIITINIDIDSDTCGSYDQLQYGYITIETKGTIINHKPLSQIEKEIESIYDLNHNNYHIKTIFKSDQNEHNSNGSPDHPLIVDLAFKVLNQFKSHFDRYPYAWNVQDANQMVELCLYLFDKYPSILLRIHEASSSSSQFSGDDLTDTKNRILESVRKLSFINRFRLVPVESLVGGLASQEIFKAVTHLYIPLDQFIYIDQSSLIQDYSVTNNQVLLSSPPTKGAEEIPKQYLDLISIIGWKGFQTLLDLNIVLLGLQGNASETLKNLLLLGVGCGKEGQVNLVDKGYIQKSNLTKYYLIRKDQDDHLIGLPLASTFSKIFYSKLVQPTVYNYNNNNNNYSKKNNIIPYQKKISNMKSTEYHSFPRDMIENTDFLISCCTSTKFHDFTRHIHKSCDHNIKFIEAGSSSVGSHLLLTISHYSIAELPRPYSYEFHSCHSYHVHSVSCITSHSNQIYQSLFYEELSNYDTFHKDRKNINTNHRTFIITYQTTFRQCVNWAVTRFISIFHTSIIKTTTVCPRDRLNFHKTGYFWACPLRYPSAIEFDPNNKSHLEFVYHASHIRATLFPVDESDEIGPDRSFESIRLYLLQNFQRPNYHSIGSVSDAIFEEITFGNIGTQLDLTTIPPSSTTPFKLIENASKYIKVLIDQGNPHCYPLFNAITTLKYHALNVSPDHYPNNYAYKFNNRFNLSRSLKSLVGTNVISGAFSSLTVLASIKSPTGLSLKNVFYNLSHSEIIKYNLIPQPSCETDDAVTFWSYIEINQKDMTLQQLLDYLHSKYRVDVTMISCSITLMYAKFLPDSKNRERLPLKIVTLYTSLTSRPLPTQSNFIEIDTACDSLDIEPKDVELPTIRFRFRD